MAEPTAPPLLGVGRRNAAAPNTFRSWQYILIAFVLLLGGLYASPNLFQPDPALQIRAIDESLVITDAEVSRLNREAYRSRYPSDWSRGERWFGLGAY